MNKTWFASITAAGAFLLFSGVAFAQDTVAPSGKPLPQNAREKAQMMQEKRIDLKNTLKNVREDFKTQTKVLRQDTTGKLKEATSSAERRDILKNAREEKRVIKDERRESAAAIKTQLKMLVRQHVGAISQRFAIALKQFDNTMTRIQSRIEKLKANGIDTSAADTLFESAKVAVAQAKSDVQALTDLVAQVSDTGDAKTVRAQVDTAVKKASASVKAAHSALESTAKALVKLARSQKAQTKSVETAPPVTPDTASGAASE